MGLEYTEERSLSLFYIVIIIINCYSIQDTAHLQPMGTVVFNEAD